MINQSLTLLTLVLTGGLVGAATTAKQVSAVTQLASLANAASFQTDQKVNDTSATSIISNAPTIASSTTSTTSASTDQYLDDRSTPVQLLKSYYNAINRSEYVRAYYYWGSTGKTATSQPPAYPQFAAGYAKTKAVQLTTGKVKSEGAAGSIYYQVPVSLVATLSDSSKLSYVGCYTIRQPNPQNFGAPPFIPMHIESALIRQVSSRSNLTSLMNSSCR